MHEYAVSNLTPYDRYRVWQDSGGVTPAVITVEGAPVDYLEATTPGQMLGFECAQAPVWIGKSSASLTRIDPKDVAGFVGTLPAPSLADAGKIAVVNAAGDGYDLAAMGGSLAFPNATPQLRLDYGGGAIGAGLTPALATVTTDYYVTQHDVPLASDIVAGPITVDQSGTFFAPTRDCLVACLVELMLSASGANALRMVDVRLGDAAHAIVGDNNQIRLPMKPGVGGNDQVHAWLTFPMFGPVGASSGDSYGPLVSIVDGADASVVFLSLNLWVIA